MFYIHHKISRVDKKIQLLLTNVDIIFRVAFHLRLKCMTRFAGKSIYFSWLVIYGSIINCLSKFLMDRFLLCLLPVVLRWTVKSKTRLITSVTLVVSTTLVTCLFRIFFVFDIWCHRFVTKNCKIVKNVPRWFICHQSYWNHLW